MGRWPLTIMFQWITHPEIATGFIIMVWCHRPQACDRSLCFCFLPSPLWSIVRRARKEEFQWLQRQEPGADRLCGCWHCTPPPPPSPPPPPPPPPPLQCNVLSCQHASHTPGIQLPILLLLSSTQHNKKKFKNREQNAHFHTQLSRG